MASRGKPLVRHSAAAGVTRVSHCASVGDGEQRGGADLGAEQGAGRGRKQVR